MTVDDGLLDANEIKDLLEAMIAQQTKVRDAVNSLKT